MSNINQRLNGLEPLSYLGVNAVQPPDFITKTRPPTITDSRNFALGQIWLDTGTNTPPASNDIYMLVALIGGYATWVSMGGGSGTLSGFLTQDGNTVTPTAGIVQISGAHGLNTTGTVGPNTVTVALNNAITLGDLSSIVGTRALQVTTGDISILNGTLYSTNALGTIYSSIQAVNNVLGSVNHLNDTSFPSVGMAKDRAGAIVHSGDNVGVIEFQGWDGVDYLSAGQIAVDVTGTPGVGRMPGIMHFYTTPDSVGPGRDRMQIASTGEITIFTPDSGTSLTISALAAGALVTSTTGQVSAADGGIAGHVLTSNGTNTTPTFQAPANSGPFFFGVGSPVPIVTSGKAWISPYGTINGLQANNNFAVPFAGTISRLYVDVGTNSTVVGTTITINKNSVNTSIVATIPAGTTGEFTDLVHSFTVVAGDTIQFESSDGGINTVTGTISAQFAPSTVSGNAALILLGTQTTASATELDFTAGITPAYNNYLFIIDSINCPTGAGSDSIYIQLSTDGGATYITSGYNGVGIGLNIAAGTTSGSANAIVSGSFYINNATSGSGYIMSNGTVQIYDSASFASALGLGGGTYKTPNIVVNAMRIIITGNKAFSGSASLYALAQ